MLIWYFFNSLYSFIWLQKGAFDDPDVIHVEGEVEPIRDLDIISEELRLKDVETLMKSLDKLEKVAKGGQSNDKKIRPEYVSIVFLLLIIIYTFKTNFRKNQRLTWPDTTSPTTLFITFYLKSLLLSSHCLLIDYHFTEWYLIFIRFMIYERGNMFFLFFIMLIFMNISMLLLCFFLKYHSLL